MQTLLQQQDLRPRFRLGEALPPLADFDRAERDGRIWSKTRTTRDGRTLRLFNYTPLTQYKRNWDPVTLIARGLIVCLDDLVTEAAPLTKFFNLGEPLGEGRTASARSGRFDLYVKMDGSLGVGYRADQRISWATRGSFESPQSVIAQQLWDSKYADKADLFFDRWNHLTPMVEIIHRQTRVVVRYQFEDLVLLALRDRFTGLEARYELVQEVGAALGMPVVERLDGGDIDSVLRRAAELDDNHEGFVAAWAVGSDLSDGAETPEFNELYRLKVKGEPYKRLHRVLTGITASYLAECWFDGTQESLLMAMPEECRGETEETLRQLDEQVIASVAYVDGMYASAPAGADKGTFARWINSTPKLAAAKGLLFNRLEADREGATRALALSAIARQLEAGKLLEQVESTGVEAGAVDHTEPAVLGEGALTLALGFYEDSVSRMLRDDTRTAEGRVRINRLMERLDRSLRPQVASALHGLQPDLLIARMRAYVAEPAQRKLFGELDVDAMFAAAPSPEGPVDLHKDWVYKQPLPLRSYLDRWRDCNRPETPLRYARAILAQAIRQERVEELLSKCGLNDCHGLARRLDGLAQYVSAVWEALPVRSNPAVLLQAARASDSPWAMALLCCAWNAYRAQVRDAYCAANKDDSDRFEEG